MLVLLVGTLRSSMAVDHTHELGWVGGVSAGGCRTVAWTRLSGSRASPAAPALRRPTTASAGAGAGRLAHLFFPSLFRQNDAGRVSLADLVLWWILIGIMAAALIGAYVPEHWFMQYLGPHFTGLLLTLLVATVLEVCSEGTSPIAFEIFNKVGVLGNPFIFLMAGVATDYTEIGLLWTNIGKRTAIWLPLISVPQILLLGMILNGL